MEKVSGTMTNIYVGNLPYETADADLRDLFAAYGDVASARVIIDRAADRSRGFGFVEMPDASAASAAIQALDGSEYGGRALRVNEARPPDDRPPRRDHASW